MQTTLHPYYLQQMGIDVWTRRENKIKKKSLDDLAKEVFACVRCPLHQCRTQTVFARGNPDAQLMIIGEAPGYYEDKEGLPFVGKAGGLLNKMLSSIGLSQEDVYIANVLKCRPPHNRDPQTDEIQQCRDFLIQQIACVAPKLILAVGRFSGGFLLDSSDPLHKMRNKIYDYHGISVLVTYHPAYLLRNPKDKKHAFNDLLMAKKILFGGG